MEAPNLDQEPVKCQNQSEKPEISILKKTSHVQVHLQWFYSANWKIAHQKHNGDLGVHGVNVQRIVEVAKENGKGNVTQLRDTVNPQLVLVSVNSTLMFGKLEKKIYIPIGKNFQLSEIYFDFPNRLQINPLLQKVLKPLPVVKLF